MPLPTPLLPLCYVNVWRARDGGLEVAAFVVRDQALEEIGAGYPDMEYAGTATLPKTGAQANFEDWSQNAHQYAVEATDGWLEREKRVYLAKVL